MKFRVVVLPRAKRQLYNSAVWWAEHRSAQQAWEWLTCFESVLKSLQEQSL